MDIKLKDIGARIERIIKKEGISRAQLGALLELGEGAVGRHIRGETDPGTIALAKIAALGGITIDELVLGKKPLVIGSAYGEAPKPGDAIALVEPYPRPPNLDETEWLILQCFRNSDAETRGDVLEKLLKFRSKPEGQHKNGTEG